VVDAIEGGAVVRGVVVWWILALVLHEQTVKPLQTLANVVGALREEDYSFRARGAVAEDALGELSLEVNALADLLADQRIRAIEATALLRRVWRRLTLRCLRSIRIVCCGW